MKLPLFSAFGVEIEYMLVSRDRLEIQAIADQLLAEAVHGSADDYVNGEITWSNELALHVIELKNSQPVPSLTFLPELFNANIQTIQQLLTKFNARLLPTGAHPWMNPRYETKLWPSMGNEVYAAYDRIFDCHNHGWSNLQSVHLNLPFANDEEFAKLHASIRLLLPIIPAISASSPLIEAQSTGYKDSRLHIYAHNQQKIPSLTGNIIPEPVSSKQEYETQILQKIYTDLKPHDPENILQYEWANSRGAIARFDRNTIEIRVIDTQECPTVDIAILELMIAVLKALTASFWQPFAEQYKITTSSLQNLFHAVIKNGGDAIVDDQAYLRCFGWQEGSCSVKELWQHIVEQLTAFEFFTDQKAHAIISQILQQGNLAERILKALNHNYQKNNLQCVYQRLAECVEQDQFF